MAEVLKDRSMVLQKEMIARHFERLAHAQENGEPVVYTFVPGNLTELIRSFGALPVLPEINALQSGMRKLSGDYIAEAERGVRRGREVNEVGQVGRREAGQRADTAAVHEHEIAEAEQPDLRDVREEHDENQDQHARPALLAQFR